MREGTSTIAYRIPFFVMLLGLRAFADDPAAAPPVPRNWTVFATCQMVIVSQKAALPLVAEFSEDEKADAAWDKVQKMIETGEATLVAELVSKGVQGQNLVSETVEEMRYAAAYEPPQLPEKIPAENAVEALKAWPHVGIVPTAFETRNVGQTLAVSVRVSDDGKWLDADHVNPSHVRFWKWASTSDSAGEWGASQRRAAVFSQL